MNVPVTDLEIHLVDPLQDPKWDRTASTFEECDFFQSVAWARVLRRA